MVSHMRSFRELHPVHIAHRVGAAVLGVVLWVFAGLGFAHASSFLSTDGVTVMGMSTNGALAAISVVVGILLVGGAVVGGTWASSLSVGFGALFILSGVVHLGILHTPANLLAFRLPNVFFSLVVGVALLVLGMFGRVSGGLPPDNPYRRAAPRRADRPDPDEQLRALDGQSEVAPEEAQKQQDLAEAEMAMGEGTPTAEQARMVEDELARHQAEERKRAYRAYRKRWPRGRR